MSKLIIVHGPSTSGKSRYAEAWRSESPGTRVVISEANFERVRQEIEAGYDVMVTIVTPEGVEVESLRMVNGGAS